MFLLGSHIGKKYTLIRQLLCELSNQGILYLQRRKKVTLRYDESSVITFENSEDTDETAPPGAGDTALTVSRGI